MDHQIFLLSLTNEFNLRIFYGLFRCHCEHLRYTQCELRKAISSFFLILDCFVALLVAMTRETACAGNSTLRITAVKFIKKCPDKKTNVTVSSKDYERSVHE
jgi:hypothetical protein